MNWKQLIRLLIVAVVVIGIGVFLNWMRYKAEEKARGTMGTEVLADFPLNDIHAVEIVGPEIRTTLVKQQELWRVQDRYGYPADFAKLRNFLVSLRDLKVTQPVIAAPSQYGRLGLAAPAEAEGAGTKLVFHDKDGTALETLILGKPHQNMDQQGMGMSDGRFIRVARENEDMVALVSNIFSRVEAEPKAWLDKEFIAIRDVVQVSLKDQNGVKWELHRDDPSAEWELTGFEQTEQQKLKANEARTLGNAFNYASFEDVADPELPAAETGLDSATVFSARTSRGILHNVSIGRKNEEGLYYVTLEAAYEPVEIPGQTENAPDAADEDGDEADQPETNDGAPENDANTALDINERFGKWIYLVSSYSVEQVLKDRETLIEKAVPKDDPMMND